MKKSRQLDERLVELQKQSLARCLQKLSTAIAAGTLVRIPLKHKPTPTTEESRP
jgi:hypothetical protein